LSVFRRNDSTLRVVQTEGFHLEVGGLRRALMKFGGVRVCGEVKKILSNQSHDVTPSELLV
jgi:hypothetical protein